MVGKSIRHCLWIFHRIHEELSIQTKASKLQLTFALHRDKNLGKGEYMRYERRFPIWWLPNFLGERYIFPLATKDLWQNNNRISCKCIFLMHDINSGCPLRGVAIRELRGYDYMKVSKKWLIERKVTLINSSISKGLWMSLLGVVPLFLRTI